jgi:hypothetical protein
MTDFRCDRATIKHWEDTPEGFLRFTAPVGREGILTYGNKDGSVRREHVSLDVLKTSADSLKIKPITTPGHPPGLINKDTAKPYLAGSTGNSVWLDSGFLWVTGTVFDGETIESIKSGRTKELSLGYGVETVVRADGDFDQTKRHVNHLSPVTSARASGAGFKLDGDDEALVSLDAIDAPVPKSLLEVSPEKQSKKTKEKPMTYKAVLDGIELSFETMDEAKHVKGIEKELSKLRSDSAATKEKLDAATIALDEAKTELGTVKAEIVTQKTALDAAEETVKTAKEDRLDEDAINTLIGDRMKLWQEVLPMMRSDNADYEPDYSLAPLGIMTAAVKVANPDIATHLDGLDLSDSENSGFVKGLYAGLNTKQYSQKSATRSDANTLLAEIRANRFDAATGGMKSISGKSEMEAELALEAARKKRADRILNANKK